MDRREAELKDQQKAIRAELKEIQVARAALNTDVATAAVIAAAPALPTIKEMARSVLSTAERGLTSGEILTAISEGYGRDLERTSLSPQLSRLKDDQELVLDGERWFTKAMHEAALARVRAEEMLEDASADFDDGPAIQADNNRGVYEEDDDCPF